MANPEHLAILKQGVEVWNRWREANPSVVVDLTDADLPNSELGPTPYDKSDPLGELLYLIDLRNARLSGINLRKSDLWGASLRGADLSGADLGQTVLSTANLDGANLREASLDEAKLSRTTLSGADLTGAFLGETVFIEVDLSTTTGLEQVKHNGPSTLDIHTLAISGRLPLKFLRGTGLPDILIEYLPAFFTGPIHYYSCFISYSTKDQEFADRLYADLQNKGVRCWFAPEDLKIGDPFRQRIDESIRIHDKLLLILSEHSVQSTWVQDEVESALDRERREGRLVLFPIRIDDAVMETEQAWAKSIRLKRHIGDFTRWKDHDSYQKAFDGLLRDLKAEENSRPRGA